MNDLDRFFNDDPWDGIKEPCYPEGRRLYMKDDRFWVSMDENENLLFFVHEEGVRSAKVINNLSSVNVEITAYGDVSSRLVCTLLDEDGGLREKFAVVAKDVAHSCSDYSGKQLFSKVLERIKSWADFLKPKRAGLSRAEFLGLFGELYVLGEMVLPSFDPLDAVQFWVGPEMRKQDFTFNSFAVDVKSTMAGSANTISISSLDQLDRITERLYLLRVVLSPASEGSGITLRELYDSCIGYLENNLEARARFFHKVSDLYGKASEGQLSEYLSVANVQLYEVTDEFPCLTRSQVPGEISDVHYEIYASRISDFLVDKDIREVIACG